MSDHILIVEDSATQAERLKQLLSANGYAVTVASNGKEGLAAARERKPAVIISDITMPVMDGYQMCRAIKDDETLRHTPVVLLTELSEPSDLVRGIQAGTDFYLTKPYEEQELLARLESVLAMPNGSGCEEGEHGLEITVAGQSYVVNAGRQQILNLLLSTYENAVQKNRRLVETQFQLEELNHELENRVQHRTRQLQDSEYRYRALFEQAADSIVLVDPHSGALVEFNDRAHESLGYTREEFAELKIPDFELLETPEEVTEHTERVLREGSDVFETKHRTKGGESRDILVSSSTISLKGRDFVQSIWTDITKRKRAERLLAATNAQLEDALAWARESAEIANALSEAASVLNSTLNLDDVLDRILVAVGRVTPHDAANIMLLSKADGNEQEAKIVRGRGYGKRGHGQSLLKLRLRLTDVPNLLELADTGLPRAISDTQASDKWVPIPETAWIRSWAGAPLRVEGETIGFLNVSSEKAGFFTQESADRLQAFADQAAVAIHNARLYSQAEVEI
ncbi:MAG: response regulator, partial [Anaerolineales bacterium]